LGWLPRYPKRWFRPDLIAGISVAALVVPKSLGYAGIAGVPIQNGLYAAAAGSLIYALFGTSRQIATGPSSALAAVAAATVVTTGVSGDDSVEIVTGITLVAGLLFLLIALLKMGWISQFLSKAVITGFLFGAAIEVVVGELFKLTGTESSGDNSWQKLINWFESLGDTDGTTLLVGLVALAVIVGLRYVAPAVPGALVLVVGGVLCSWLFDLGDAGVALVGDVPRGFAAPGLPDLELMRENFAAIVSASIGLVLIGFSQTAGDAREFADKHRYNVDINQESVAQGMCNIGSSVVQGIPVSTSLSASSLNDASGAKSPVASLMTGVSIVLTLLIFAPLFSDLPSPVLAAIIIDAVVFGMMDVPAMKRLYRVKRFDFWIAIAAIFAVIVAGVLAGVIIGVVLSLVWLVYVNAVPPTPELGRRGDSNVFRSIEDYPDGETYPGLVVLRFDAGLYFATADALQDRLRQLATDADKPLHAAVIDFEGVNFIDSQGSAKIDQILILADAVDATIYLARVKLAVLEVLTTDGVVDRLGEDHLHGQVYEAVDAALAEMGSSRD
jgi:high affinity sulfate transporter 1